MSRSYKKHHIIKDRNAGMKDIANRSIRRVPIGLTDTLNYGGYKRHFESWNISDFSIDGDWFYPIKPEKGTEDYKMWLSYVFK